MPGDPGSKFLFDPAPIYCLNCIKEGEYFVAKKGGYGIIEYKIGAGLKFLQMADVKKTVLFDRHAALAGKAQLVPFAGWMMPLWYKSISAEHEAVRKTAGLFDCTHMAVLKITGKNAADFLNILTTNDVSRLKPGKAQYSYILNSAGDIIDDCFVYCISDNDFMLVANAANEQKVKDWIGTVRSEHIQCDDSWQVDVADLKDESLPDARVDIALQGHASAQCLKSIFNVEIEGLKFSTFIQGEAEGVNVIIAATGYTGAKVAFELFVHPNRAGQLWDLILEKGKALGIVPCGLGARDSLRIEAGLPLYGHELAGDFNISPFQAGYGWAVKLQKENFTPTPIPTDRTILESPEKDSSAQSSIKSQSKLVCGFIGKKAVAKKAADFDTEVARLKFSGEKGVRPIRQLDGILNTDGRCIGYCLSSAAAGDKQIVLALIKKEYNTAGKIVGVYYLARNAGHIQQGRKERVIIGDLLTADIDGQVVERFEKF
ncbi:MAG: glycine cleavage system protein T [Planctomycetes bacterium RBG_13_44_8b]|nr:MAG: glycine cleavage system protein T [Planctomycetes bacterium RBG_13_44_8b]